ncbi:MAG: hypothetical protein JXA00_06095 [Candidatus Thermoplasmatota archaeon]|nr:hypothetical protein [Candidatus Thermoplasmatota archaeon]
MVCIQNAVLITRVIEGLYKVVGRRTLDSFAIQLLKNTTKKLQPTYEFFSWFELQDESFIGTTVQIRFDARFDALLSPRLGEAIDALVRVIYLELLHTIGDEVGRYFITELKEHLGDEVIDSLSTCGVHLEELQVEQHLRYQMKGLHPSPPRRPDQDEELRPEYTWDSVSTWKYENNICRLFDSKGTLLDTLYLDLIIEEYVERLAESKESDFIPSPKTTMLKISAKEDELLAMMRRRDIDVDSAVALLHVSRQKLDTMIQKLLQLEMLKYISDSEVKLTEKGIQYLSEKQS